MRLPVLQTWWLILKRLRSDMFVGQLATNMIEDYKEATLCDLILLSWQNIALHLVRW
jgi:hypothetical protein